MHEDDWLVTPLAILDGTFSFCVSFDVITGIQQLEESQPVDVYSVDGKLIRRQAKTLDDLKGVYIINGRGVIMK